MSCYVANRKYSLAEYNMFKTQDTEILTDEVLLLKSIGKITANKVASGGPNGASSQSLR